MHSGNIWYIIKLLPLLAFCALVFGLIGWWLRSLLSGNHGSNHEVQKVVNTTQDNSSRARIKKLEEKIQKADSDYKSIKGNYEALQKSSVSTNALEMANQEIAALKELDTANQKRIAAFETDSKKAQASIVALNANLNDANRQQKDRTFTLENELSKAREQLSRFESSTNKDSEYQNEIDRLRESLANATRVTGELRRQEAATAEALAACEARCEKLGEAPKSISSITPLIGPIDRSAPVESDRIAAARAEVIRLNAERQATKKSEQLAFAEPALESAAVVQTISEIQPVSEPITTNEISTILAASDTPTLGEKAIVASEIWGKRISQDDLKIVEGIGPKICELLNNAGINTWSNLADTTVERIQEILESAGDSYTMHDPSTWPRQAAMANDGKWAELKAWQDELDGGKE